MNRDAPILLVDDHAAITTPLVMALQTRGFTGAVSLDPTDLGADAVVTAAEKMAATIVLLDLHLGGTALSIPMIPALVAGGAKVVVFTASQDDDLLGASLQAGAVGVLDKSLAFDLLVAALDDLLADRDIIDEATRDALVAAFEQRQVERVQSLAPFRSLTATEVRVLTRLVDGDAPKTIARDSGVSLSTVRGHIEKIFTKLRVSSQREALALARTAGWPERGPSAGP